MICQSRIFKLDININNFMNFELQNNLQIFMILTTQKKSKYFENQIAIYDLYYLNNNKYQKLFEAKPLFNPVLKNFYDFPTTKSLANFRNFDIFHFFFITLRTTYEKPCIKFSRFSGQPKNFYRYLKKKYLEKLKISIEDTIEQYSGHNHIVEYLISRDVYAQLPKRVPRGKHKERLGGCKTVFHLIASMKLLNHDFEFEFEEMNSVRLGQISNQMYRRAMRAAKVYVARHGLATLGIYSIESIESRVSQTGGRVHIVREAPADHEFLKFECDLYKYGIANIYVILRPFVVTIISYIQVPLAQEGSVLKEHSLIPTLFLQLRNCIHVPNSNSEKQLMSQQTQQRRIFIKKKIYPNPINFKNVIKSLKYNFIPSI
ncbi:hypothetical protein AGLY_000867 [Aphis glycines]|uniref:Uncharacterized protein n=1 Tax=Aphis glycines TaxID=307491 RepID=A0A6G0U8C3_APHGL|nr:hypothetical protein AGLY_000867 [Aphis glycines]